MRQWPARKTCLQSNCETVTWDFQAAWDKSALDKGVNFSQVDGLRYFPFNTLALLIFSVLCLCVAQGKPEMRLHGRTILPLVIFLNETFLEPGREHQNLLSNCILKKWRAVIAAENIFPFRKPLYMKLKVKL